MQPRDVTRLEAGPFDLLVVGGGIHGLAAAYEAASRGLRTALVEAEDFGSGISFNHQKTAHGGLRSLQSLRLDRAGEAIRERRTLARIAPWFLQRLPFVVGTYRSVTRGRPALRAAFLLDGWLGRDRNLGVAPERHLPRARLLSRTMTRKLFPQINPRRLTGGAQWYDYQMVESDRLTLAFAAAADACGAVLTNYVEAIGALREEDRIVGMRVRDRESGRTLDVRATLTINAAGSRAGEVRAMFGVDRPLPLVAAMNFVTTARPAEVALAAPTRAGRMLTLVPWRQRSIVGTSHSRRLVTPADARASAEDIDAFIQEANEAFPALGLTRDRITLVHRGLVPAVARRTGEPGLAPAPAIEEHAAEGAPGAMTIIGVKYTTARGVAERAIDRAGRQLGWRLPRSTTAVTPLPGAGFADHEGLAIESARRAGVSLAPAVLRRLSALYGERSADVIRLMCDQPAWQEPLADTTVATGAEIVHVIRQEMAVRLPDIVLRRTGLGAAGHPGAGVLAACVRIAAAELRWSTEQAAEQAAAVEGAYRIP
jgi:glycerol-3-phosphate dehydrogenase